MKKMIIVAVAIIISAACTARNIEVEAFTGIHVNVPADVRVVRGTGYGVRISSSNKEVARSVRATVKKNTLRLDTRDLEAIPEGTDLKIVVVVPVDCRVKAGDDVVINSEKVYDQADHDVAMR